MLVVFDSSTSGGENSKASAGGRGVDEDESGREVVNTGWEGMG